MVFLQPVEIFRFFESKKVPMDVARKGCDFGELNDFAEVRLKGLVQAWNGVAFLWVFFNGWKDGWKLR